MITTSARAGSVSSERTGSTRGAIVVPVPRRRGQAAPWGAGGIFGRALTGGLRSHARCSIGT
jgi:hypothetical protein